MDGPVLSGLGHKRTAGILRLTGPLAVGEGPGAGSVLAAIVWNKMETKSSGVVELKGKSRFLSRTSGRL